MWKGAKAMGFAIEVLEFEHVYTLKKMHLLFWGKQLAETVLPQTATADIMYSTLYEVSFYQNQCGI